MGIIIPQRYGGATGGGGVPPGGVSFLLYRSYLGLGLYGTLRPYGIYATEQGIPRVTTYTWNRGRAGASGSDSTASVLNVGLAVYAPGTALTIRRLIVDWGLDLFNETKDGTVNGYCPVTVGVIATTGSSSSPAAPSGGPGTDPSANWLYWAGAWFSNSYGIVPGSGIEGAMSANGRLDRRNPTDLATGVYTKLWLSVEVQDVDEEWSAFITQAWWQVLTAPTGS
jgi:hypothetical protein